MSEVNVRRDEMADHRFYFEAKMNIADVANRNVRRRVFEEISRDLIEGLQKHDSNDALDVLSSVLESAFRTGNETAADAMKNGNSVSHQFMTDADIPEASREAVSWIRHAIFGTTVIKMRECLPRAVALVFVKSDIGSVDGRDPEWIQSGIQHINQYSDDALNPLVELGLITMSPRDNAGILSEWGYELAMTGRTLLPEHRSPSASSTSSEWAYLVRSGALRKGMALLSRAMPSRKERLIPAFG